VYETVLPISLVESHGLPEWGWGPLIIVNPILVTLFQLRLTRRVEHVPAAPKYLVAPLLMGLPFLLPGLASTIPVILFVLGDFAMWAAFAGVAVVGGVLGAAACLRVRHDGPGTPASASL